jgi:ATP synthase F1 complex assembly factor 2
VELQKKHWDPIIHWARETFKIEIKTFDSIFSTPQSPETLAKLDHVMSKLDPWQMAGMVTPPSPLKSC